MDLRYLFCDQRTAKIKQSQESGTSFNKLIKEKLADNGAGSTTSGDGAVRGFLTEFPFVSNTI